jgi:hypothetical protein
MDKSTSRYGHYKPKWHRMYFCSSYSFYTRYSRFVVIFMDFECALRWISNFGHARRRQLATAYSLLAKLLGTESDFFGRPSSLQNIVQLSVPSEKKPFS